MFKPCLLSLALFSGFTFAVDSLPVTPMMGDITKAQFMKRAEQRFAVQDQNGDGVLSVAEKEAALTKMEALMKQAGKPVPERMSGLKPKGNTTKAQYMERQEIIFSRLDKNGDGVIGEMERADIKAHLDKRVMESTP